VVKRVLLPVAVFAPLVYLLPKLMLFYALCGAYDIARNRPVEAGLVRRYFFGNGIPTWLLSPFNIAMDLLTLPYLNKGVYRLADLPPAYQAELRQLIETARNADLVGKVEQSAKANRRTMIFFKWYGGNVAGPVEIPAFHRPWRYVRTIGVSVFNRKASTSKHFGPIRATLRVLYNLNDVLDDSAYIVVGDRANYWRQEKLFIFDDTLMHQSFNESDRLRYCLFADILRPSLLPVVVSAIVRGVRLISRSFNFIFYKHWNVIQR
jgi:beta-hydroxylase